MWLSKKLAESNAQAPSNSTEIGNLSIATNDLVAAISNCEKRGISFFAPFGVEFLPTEGQKVLLLSCGNQTACAGVEMKSTSNLSAGELRLFSRGGASILLKNDGSIVLNDAVTISKNGNIKTNGTITASEYQTIY